MQGLRAAILAAICLALASGSAAHAATAIYYSSADDYYGWAAGYSYSRSEQTAESECRNAGGGDCRLAVECAGGWSAIAFADDSAKGVGMVCGVGSAHTARTLAIALCMHESRAMCWTEAAFDSNGNAISRDRNDSFDRTYLAQQLLYALEYLGENDSTDGVLGPRTRQAIQAFQTRVGVPANGELTLDLLWRLLNGVRGPKGLGQGLYNALVKNNLDELSGHIYATSVQPRPDWTYSEELATYGSEEQRRGLATLLTLWDRKCTLPASEATPEPAGGRGGWHVRCAEGDFTIVFSDQTHVIATGLRTITVEGDTVTVGGASIESPPEEPRTPRPSDQPRSPRDRLSR